MNLIEKYLGEGFKVMPTRNPDKLEKLLKKKNIKYKVTSKGIEVDDKEYTDIEELMARNLLF